MATFLAGLAFMLLSQAASAWGPLGHRAIGAVADALLAPGARAELARLLEGDRDRDGRPSGRASLAEVSLWADEIRGTRADRPNWHYDNVPVCGAVPRQRTWCPQQHCASGRIEAMLAQLADRGAPLAQRRDALKWISHLVADLHQPLHAADYAQGGNLVHVDFGGGAGASRACGFAPSAGRPVADRIEPACARRRARLPRLQLRRRAHRDGFVAARLPAARRARDHIAAGAGGRTAGDDIESGLDRAVALQPPASVRPDDRSDHAAPAPRAAARLVARRRPAAAFAPVDAQAPAGASALVLELPDAPALAGASALVLDLPDAAGPAGASALAAELPDEPALGPDPADTSSPGVNPAGRPRSREHPVARAAARW